MSVYGEVLGDLAKNGTSLIKVQSILLIIFIPLVPLGIWKLIEIIIYLSKHIGFRWIS